MPATVLESPRLRLQELEPDDAGLILRVLNTEGFLRHVGDRGVHNGADALEYLTKGPLASYRDHGYGLWKVTRSADGSEVGISGLVRRDSLPAPDLGYAFLPEFAGQGLATEAGAAILRHGLAVLGLPRILAIVSHRNLASVRVLEKIGMASLGFQDVSGESLLVFFAEGRTAKSDSMRRAPSPAPAP